MIMSDEIDESIKSTILDTETKNLFRQYMVGIKDKKRIDYTSRDVLIRLLHYRHKFVPAELAEMFKLSQRRILQINAEIVTCNSTFLREKLDSQNSFITL